MFPHWAYQGKSLLLGSFPAMPPGIFEANSANKLRPAFYYVPSRRVLDGKPYDICLSGERRGIPYPWP
jgi:hypothetical protein